MLPWILVACIGSSPLQPPTRRGTDSGTPGPTGPTTGESGDVLAPRFRSGSRLRARSVGGEGAAERVFAYFWDTKLGVACAFALASDGVPRCLPVPDLPVTDVHLDAACSQPVTAYTCGDAPYVLRATPLTRDDECDPIGETIEVRAIEPVAAPDGLYVPLPDGGCGPAPDGVVAGQPGATLPPSTFVSAAVQERWTEQGLGVRELVAEDGAMRRLGLLTGADGPCTLRYLADLGPRCVPDDAAEVGAGPEVDWWWADSQCRDEPLAYALADPCAEEPPRVALELDSLEGPPRLHRLGAPWSRDYAWDSRAGCVETPIAQTPWTLHHVAGRAARHTLAPLSLRVEARWPVSFTWFEDDFGLLLAPGFAEGPLGRSGGGPFQLPDGRACTPLLSTDGGARCLTSDVRVSEGVRYFADAACTAELVPVSRYAPSQVAVVSPRVCGVATGGEAVLISVHDIGPPRGGPELYQSAPGGVCSAAQPAPGVVYRSLGESVTAPTLTVE